MTYKPFRMCRVAVVPSPHDLHRPILSCPDRPLPHLLSRQHSGPWQQLVESFALVFRLDRADLSYQVLILTVGA